MRLISAGRVTVLWVVLGLLVALAVACSGGPAPTATPGATPTATAVAATSTPAATVPPDLAERLAQIERRVIDIRGLPDPYPVPHRFVSVSEAVEYLTADLMSEESVKDVADAEAFLKLLGLIPQDADLLDLYGTLFSAQILGLYDPEEEVFLVVESDDGFGALEELTYAHEYVHRLQDAAVDLDAMTESLISDGDAAAAFSALVEGDASAVQQRYLFRHLDLAALNEMLEAALAAQDEADAVPFVLRRALEFPYAEGASFVESLLGRSDFGPIDEAYRDPPSTTEQVLHPAKYHSREGRLPVDVPHDALGAGWEVLEEDRLGEFFLRTWLEALEAPSGVAAAAGWGGDEYLLLEDAEGSVALVMLIAWDDPAEDAVEFGSLLSALLDLSPEFVQLEPGTSSTVSVWDGPGGVLGLTLVPDGLLGDLVVVAVTPETELTIEALAALGGG